MDVNCYKIQSYRGYNYQPNSVRLSRSDILPLTIVLYHDFTRNSMIQIIKPTSQAIRYQIAKCQFPNDMTDRQPKKDESET